MRNVTWPTAMVLAVFVGGWVTLAALGKPIPAWMAAVGAIAGKAIVAIVQARSCGKPTDDKDEKDDEDDSDKGGNGGGGATVTRIPTLSPKTNGPTPPSVA